MPRRPRNFLSCSFFHLIVQGINKEYIFANDIYKNIYLKLIKNYSKKFDIKLLAYCIMNNHTHILVYSSNISNISNFMKSINTTYAKYFNQTQERVGYVFRDRFLSQPINSEVHLFKCIAYIHNNPVKAHLVENLLDYKFSSYRDYLYKNGIINNEILNLIFGPSHNSYIETLSPYYNCFTNDIADIKEDCISTSSLISNFVNSINIPLTEILKDSHSTSLLIKYLHTNGISIRKISSLLGISRNIVYKYIKN